MNFAVAFLYLLPFINNPDPCLAASVAEINLPDSSILLIKIQYPENFHEEFKNNSFFMEQLAADFRQKSKKQNMQYQLVNSENYSGKYDLLLNFTFYNVQFGEERSEQSMRMATMKNMQTVFDREAEQHKRQDVDYTADVSHFKKSIESNASIIMTISRPGSDSVLFSKSSDAKYNWVNEYVTYKGDKEALTTDELQLSKNKSLDAPLPKTLFKELIKIMFRDITAALDSFLKEKKGF